MDEKELKTSWKQRLLIIVIAVIMLGSVIIGYALVIANGNKNTSSDGQYEIDQAELEQYIAKYQEAQDEFSVASQSDFERFITHKGLITAYNEGSANSGGVQIEDVEVGTGAEIGEEDTNYLAYYVGWCADEEVFDSSFDSADNPTKFVNMIDVSSVQLIEGWNLGVTGMKRDGIRIITIPGELAYGESMEICGGTNKPIRFMIMAKAREGALLDAYQKLINVYYGS